MIVTKRPRVPRRHHHRDGLTLFEVVLSIAILLGSMVAIGELISVGSRASVQAELRSEAALLAQSKISEVVSGSLPMTSVASASFENRPNDWTYSIEVLPGPMADLLQITVTVQHLAQNGQPNVTQTLTRYVRDPLLFSEAAISDGSTVIVE